jgi:hypothetical protein
MCNLQTIKNGAVKHYCASHELFTDSLRCPLSGYKQASALDLLTLGERKLVVVDGQIVRVVTDEAREETRHGYRSYQTKTYTKIYAPVGQLKIAEVGEVVWWKVEEVAAISDWGEV